MTIYTHHRGNPIQTLRACAGAPAIVNLTTIALGGSQGGYLANSDYQIVTAADSTNKAITLWDPNKYGGTAGDLFIVANGQSGQTLNVFPPTGGAFNAGSANAALTVGQGVVIRFILVSWTPTTSVWIAN